MSKEQLLRSLEKDSFNGVISITEFRQKVQDYAEMYHSEQCAINCVGKRFTFIKEGGFDAWNKQNSFTIEALNIDNAIKIYKSYFGNIGWKKINVL